MACLALNASFEPLTLVSVRRALRLVIDGKAEIVEADGSRPVRSERLSVRGPSSSGSCDSSTFLAASGDKSPTRSCSPEMGIVASSAGVQPRIAAP